MSAGYHDIDKDFAAGCGITRGYIEAGLLE
jgi:hypothetical protein